MKQSDWRVFGNICFGLFIVLILSAVVCVNVDWYQIYALPLIMLGFCFLVPAFVISHSIEE